MKELWADNKHLLSEVADLMNEGEAFRKKFEEKCGEADEKLRQLLSLLVEEAKRIHGDSAARANIVTNEAGHFVAVELWAQDRCERFTL